MQGRKKKNVGISDDTYQKKNSPSCRGQRKQVQFAKRCALPTARCRRPARRQALANFVAAAALLVPLLLLVRLRVVLVLQLLLLQLIVLLQPLMLLLLLMLLLCCCKATHGRGGGRRRGKRLTGSGLAPPLGPSPRIAHAWACFVKNTAVPAYPFFTVEQDHSEA